MNSRWCKSPSVAECSLIKVENVVRLYSIDLKKSNHAADFGQKQCSEIKTE